MADAMVTARMSQTKKDAGNKVLESLGSNASQAINDFYDYIVEHESFPWGVGVGVGGSSALSKERLAQALEWVDGLTLELSPEFSKMSVKDARRRRLGLE